MFIPPINTVNIQNKMFLKTLCALVGRGRYPPTIPELIVYEIFDIIHNNLTHTTD